MTCLDVGARGGPKSDLEPIAFAVDWVGFEPDPAECARLNALPAEPWRSIRHLPIGLAGANGPRRLFVTRNRAVSSALPADVALAARFGRADYYEVEAELEFPALTLDEALDRYEAPPPAFLKIDIEGMELEVLRAAPRALASLVGLRVEACFLAPRRGQPLFHEIDAFLCAAGFQPMDWLELHHWRRSTKTKHPRLVPGPIPYSRGQLAHGDVLYLRRPEDMADGSEAEIDRLVQAAAIALCYEQVDHAAALLRRPGLASRLERMGVDAEQELGAASRALLAGFRRDQAAALWRALKANARERLLGPAR